MAWAPLTFSLPDVTDRSVQNASLSVCPNESDNYAVFSSCTRQISRYTCPSCNIPYCSSTCYKSQKHSSCVEGFFKREIQQEELDSNPGSKARERLKMMQMLRRFEENTGAEDLESEGEEEEEDTDDLAHRFYGIDIGPFFTLQRRPVAFTNYLHQLQPTPPKSGLSSLLPNALHSSKPFKIPIVT